MPMVISFLHDSSVSNQKRVFVFCSPQGLHLLAECEHWYVTDMSGEISSILHSPCPV